MGLIKSEQAPAKVSSFSMTDIENQAHAIIMRAKGQAARILVEAQRMAEELKKQSQDEGAKEGMQAGLRQGRAEGHAAGAAEALNDNRQAMAQLIESLISATTQLDQSRRLLEADACADVLKLAVAIARRATKKIGRSDGAVLTENIREAMKLTIRAADVRIAVNPMQKQTLESALPKLQMDWPQLEHVTIIEDAQIGAGGCRIFTAGGMVDADLDEQVDRIANDLLPEIGTADERG